MYLAQFEGKSLVLEYVNGRLSTSNPPINVPKKINNMTFSVEGIRTENNYFFAKYSPEYPLIKGKGFVSKEYGDFLISLGFLTLPRTDNPGMLPDKTLMQKFNLIGWTNGEDFVCYSAYTKSLVCKSVIFQIQEDGKLQASILTDETEFTTNKYSIYSQAALGSNIMFTPGGDLIVSNHSSLPIVEVPVYCPACRCRLEVDGDHRVCTNTECVVVKNRFIGKLIQAKLYSPNPVVPVECLKKLDTRLEILNTVFKNNPNQMLLNNDAILDLLEVPGVCLSFPREYPLAALLTNQNQLSQVTKDWLQYNRELFLTALDLFETVKQKKVYYSLNTNLPLHVERWYQKVEPSEAEAFFVNGKFFMEV